MTACAWCIQADSFKGILWKSSKVNKNNMIDNTKIIFLITVDTR